jgi:two-component system sensor histidine kinase UhpB
MKTPLNLLIVDDSESDALLLVRHLNRAGLENRHRRIETLTVLNEALRAQHWDLILSDFCFPAFNAINVLQRVRESGLHTPFIIFSGALREQDIERLKQQGVADIFLKEDVQSLITRLKSLLNVS